MDEFVYEITILKEDKEFKMDNNIFLDFWDYCEERCIDCYVFENIMPIRMVFDTEEHFLEAIRNYMQHLYAIKKEYYGIK